MTRLIATTVTVSIVLTSLLGCSRFEPLAADTVTMSSVVNVGDRVRVMTRDGKTRVLTITRMNETTITGQSCTRCNQETIEIDQIGALHSKHLSVGKTAALVTGVVLLGGMFSSDSSILAPGQ